MNESGCVFVFVCRILLSLLFPSVLRLYAESQACRALEYDWQYMIVVRVRDVDVIAFVCVCLCGAGV